MWEKPRSSSRFLLLLSVSVLSVLSANVDSHRKYQPHELSVGKATSPRVSATDEVKESWFRVVVKSLDSTPGLSLGWCGTDLSSSLPALIFDLYSST